MYNDDSEGKIQGRREIDTGRRNVANSSGTRNTLRNNSKDPAVLNVKKRKGKRKEKRGYGDRQARL